MLRMKEFCEKFGIVFSDLTAKLEGVLGLTTSIKENPYCIARTHCDGMICKECYANAALNYRKNAREAYKRNTEVLTTVIIADEDLPKLHSDTGYVRFESHGDLINEIQVVNYFNMAKANPHMRCALWTKNPWIVKKAIEKYGLVKPSNLVIIGSSYYTNRAMEFSAYDFIDKVFTVYETAYAKEHGIEINCGMRKCADCGLCYENKGGRYVNEIPKREQR